MGISEEPEMSRLSSLASDLVASPDERRISLKYSKSGHPLPRNSRRGVIKARETRW